jgi:uncharacterized membrane protein
MKWEHKIWGLGALILVVALLGPLAIIWALNTLFQTGLDYTFWNWLAVVVLSVFIQTRFGQTNR